MNHQARRTIDKVRSRLSLIEQKVYARQAPIEPFQFRALESPAVVPPIDEPIDERFATIPWNTPWGQPRLDFVLRGRFTVPPGWSADGPIALHMPLGIAGDFSHPEALVYVDGEPYASCDRHHHEILLSDRWCDGDSHELALHGWTGGTTAGSTVTIEHVAPLVMGTCSIVQIDQPTRDLHALGRVALGVVEELGDVDPIRTGLLAALDEAVLMVDTREPLAENFYASVPGALRVARQAMAACGPAANIDVTASGHAHIDVAWLWPVAQTRRKAGRTFHNALRLMDEFSDFHFTQSQPQLYDYVRRDYPDLFESIKKRVAEGRWEPIGGMWVEADCNITGAEALVRQFVLGRTFFHEQFGTDSPVLWLPDVFGYAWQLPQLIKSAGLEFFFTTKISWNFYNRLPYDSFWWQGLDGTRVLTHFSPTPSNDDVHWNTYNALAWPADVFGTWKNYLHSDAAAAGETAPVLMSYGYGDGGGGPTREMVENLAVMADFPGTPRVAPGRAVDFFEELDRRCGARLPTWNGELYLEYHQGTYTTHGDVKRANRRCETALHDAELLAAWASIAAAADYPAERLDEAWKLLCLNQFHDILPGSSIAEVYVETARDHARIASIAAEIIADAVAAMSPLWHDGTRHVAINPTAFGGRLRATIPTSPTGGTTYVDVRGGSALPQQAIDDGTLVEIEVDAFGVVEIGEHQADPPTLQVRSPGAELSGSDVDSSSVRAISAGEGFVLENEILRVEMSNGGEITRLFDKEHDREVVRPGRPANVFQAFEDRPIEFDAWNIDLFINDRQWSAAPGEGATIVEDGPVRASVEFRRRLGASTIVQRVRLCRQDRRIDFATSVDWQERHTMLKVAFPVNVLAQIATYEIQWGNVARSTHTNSSWDWAQHETCAHKWVDLSEGDYGISLLNDCKYGHDIKGDVLRLTLLRSTTSPDADADRGRHEFTYSLFAHADDWRNGTVAAAYHLNDEVIVRSATARRTRAEVPAVAVPIVAVDQSNVVIETVKRAEDGNGLIVRLYEHHRCRRRVALTAGFPIAHAERCDILEQPLDDGSCSVEDNVVRFEITPYRIVTLRLVPA
jgi:alpha-mannosidase